MRVSGKEDVELVRRAQRGDREAFAELFNRLHTPVLNFVYHMLGDRQTAEDVTQDAFIRAHERVGQLGPPWDFKSWIYRIAGNLAVDHVRGGRRLVDVDESEDMAEPPTTRRPIERRIQRDEVRESVRKTLQGLPTAYRQALILRELNGLNYDEVARALECSYENARQLVHRARLRFRELHGLRVVLASGAGRCRALHELLSAYHDGEISDRDRRAAEVHLKTCTECRETREDMRKMGALLAGLVPIVPSQGWAARVLERIGSEIGPPSGAPPPGVGGGEAVGAGGGGSAGAVSAAGAGSHTALLILGIGGAAIFFGLVGAAAFLLWGGRGGGSVTPTAAPATPAASPTAPAAHEGRTFTPTPSAAVPTASATATRGVTATPTPTAGPPYVVAREEANCRFGPSTQYDAVSYLHEGQSSLIEGRNQAGDWWWIRRLDGAGHCFVWNGLVTVYGDTSHVPVIPDPPTPTPADGQRPVLAIVHAPVGPGRPDSDDTVTFTATASDNVGVARVEIWIRPPGGNISVLVKACLGTSTCVHAGGPFPAGQLEYFARAWDAAGNEAETTHTLLRIYAALY